MSTITGILVDSAVRAAVVLLLAMAMSLVLGRRSAAIRHMVWLVAVVGVMVLPVLTLVLPPLPLLPQVMPRHPEVPPSAVASARTLRDLPPTVVVAPESPPPTTGEPIALATTPPADAPVWTMVHVLPAVWLAGVLVSLLPVTLGLISLARLRRASRVIHDGPMVGTMRVLAADLGVGHEVVLLQSDARTIPMTWNSLPGASAGAVILLPADAGQWTADRLRAVLLHELSHIRRRDCLTQIITHFTCALHWFNPLMWYAAHRMLVERERACDDLVLSRQTRASDYAQHLLEIAAGPQPGRLAAFAGITMARRSNLEGRLLAILDNTRRRGSVTRQCSLLSAILVAGVVVPIAALQARDIIPEAGRIFDTEGFYSSPDRNAKVEITIASDRTISYRFVHHGPQGPNIITPPSSLRAGSGWYMCWDQQGRLWVYRPDEEAVRCYHGTDEAFGSTLVGPNGGWEGIPDAFVARLPQRLKSIYAKWVTAHPDTVVSDLKQADLTAAVLPRQAISSDAELELAELAVEKAKLEHNQVVELAKHKAATPFQVTHERFGLRLAEIDLAMTKSRLAAHAARRTGNLEEATVQERAMVDMNLEAARTRLEFSQFELDNVTELFRKNAASPIQVERKRLAVKEAEVLLRVASQARDGEASALKIDVHTGQVRLRTGETQLLASEITLDLSKPQVEAAEIPKPFASQVQRFVPDAESAGYATWSALNPTDIDWLMAMIHVGIGGKAPVLDQDGKRLFELVLQKGDNARLLVEVRHSGGVEQVELLRDSAAPVHVDGVTYQLLFPTVFVASTDAPTSNKAHVHVLTRSKALDAAPANRGPLSFRIAVTRGNMVDMVRSIAHVDLKNVDVDKEIRLAQEALAEVGPINRNDKIFAWFPVARELDDHRAMIITGQHEGKSYVMLATREPAVMLADGWKVVRAVRHPDNQGNIGVSFELDAAGAKRMRELTGSYREQPMAILFDDRVYLAPVISEPLSTPAVITGGHGGFSEAEADGIVARLLGR